MRESHEFDIYPGPDIQEILDMWLRRYQYYEPPYRVPSKDYERVVPTYEGTPEKNR